MFQHPFLIGIERDSIFFELNKTSKLFVSEINTSNLCSSCVMDSNNNFFSFYNFYLNKNLFLKKNRYQFEY